jgi:hypothetical protein
MLFNKEDNDKMHNSVFGNTPNGFYRVVVDLFDKSDEKIAKLLAIIENDFHHNIYEFRNF